MNYEEIKELLDLQRKKPKEDRYRRKDLLAMSESRDPFYAGQPNRREKAEWFAKLWNEYGGGGYHLRRLHYKILGLAVRPDGKPYQNTKDDWNLLSDGSINARHLGLVAYDAFVDRRNPPPKVEVEYSGERLYSLEGGVSSPRIEDLYPSAWGDCNLMELRQHHIEVWAEKSTMDDILIPLCRRYDVFLLTGAGFESLTHINHLLKRIVELEKPCRIFYINDYDNAGQFMPRQVSRQLQYQIERRDLQDTVDIKLKPIILLKGHVQKYELPSFLGKKQTELDALEALHPGEFEKIVRSYLDKYIDLEQASDFEGEVEEKAGEYNEEVREAINSQFADEIKSLQDKAKELAERINEAIEDIEPEALGMPNPKLITEENDWLFRSELDYFEQLGKFKQFEAEQMP